MDNFMDKLAKRFNAGEIIKANAQAEARDMKRMQERTAEYERLMQEMRRLNLKNVEVTEQVQQLIKCGIEQIEGYGNAGELLEGKIDQTDELIKEEAQSLKTAAEAAREEVQALCEDVSKLSVKADEGLSGVSGRLDEIERAVGDQFRQNQQAVYAAIKELEDKVAGTSGVEASFEQAFERLETAAAADRYATEEGLREVSGLVRQMEESLRQNEEALKTVREILVATRMSVEEGQKRLEEHVHKENVRVYRNVQAVITDEATKKARELNTRLDQLESSAKKNGGVRPLLIITFLLALASVGLQVAQILQLL